MHKGDLIVTREVNAQHLITGEASDVLVLNPYTPNHLTYNQFLTSPKLPNATQCRIGLYYYIYAKTDGAINYQDGSLCFAFKQVGLYLVTLLDNSNPNGQWNFVHLAEPDANIFTTKKAVSELTSHPPQAPKNGDRYLVTASATGAWVLRENQLAQWNAVTNIWTFENAVAGNIVHDLATQTVYLFDGLTWNKTAYKIGLSRSLNGLTDDGTNVYFGGSLDRNTFLNGGSQFGLSLHRFTRLDITVTQTASISGTQPDSPLIGINVENNKVQLITGGSAGKLGQVPQSDGFGNVVWGTMPAVSGLTSASNGLDTMGSSVVFGGTLEKDTELLTNGKRLDIGSGAFKGLPLPEKDDIRIFNQNTLFLGSNKPILLRTNGSNGAEGGLLIHNGIGLVYQSLTEMILSKPLYTAVGLLTIDKTELSLVPSKTEGDILTTVKDKPVWCALAANPKFKSVLTAEIKSSLNNEKLFEVYNTFGNALTGYLSKQKGILPISILEKGSVGTVLATTANGIEWVSKASVFLPTAPPKEDSVLMWNAKQKTFQWISLRVLGVTLP